MKYTVHALWVYCIKGHLWIDNKKLDSALSQKVPSKVSQQITVAIVFLLSFSVSIAIYYMYSINGENMFIDPFYTNYTLYGGTFTAYKPSNFIFLLC